MGGGAWKVAYADFVTAMMALFMILWISSQDEEIVIKTVQYFKDPFGIGFSDGQNGSVGQGEKQDPSQLQKQAAQKSSMVDLAFLHKLASDYYRKLNLENNEGKENPVKVNVTSDGLHVTIFNKSNEPLFVTHTDKFTNWGTYIMQNLAWLIDRNPMQIRIDSHTYRGYELPIPNYSPWELTVDRSNAARRLITQYALRENTISQVSGFADTQPLKDIPPELPVNERLEISLVIE